MAAVTHRRPSEAIEDYAKAIYSLQRRAGGGRSRRTTWPSGWA